MFKSVFGWIQRYERHLSALAMVAGFGVDTLVFARIDLGQTQIVLVGYAIACFIAIPLLHWIESRATRLNSPLPRFRLVLPLITQFALGGFWSAFVIFYGRSAVLGVSWPFLIFLFLIFLGSEYFHQYHERLVFTSVLFFFALYNCAIFMVPIYTGSMGTMVFLLSGLVAICAFALFTILLRIVAPERFLADIWRIRAGAFAIIGVMSLFYFTDILPPLPLSAEAVGIYHSVWRVPDDYLATSESESWQVRYLGVSPTLHVAPGETLSAYSSIFAPTALATTIRHKWQWYDPTAKRWILKATVAYPIAGGREGGYRGYTTVFAHDAGEWRVSVETVDGRHIAQIPFTVEQVATSSPTETITLK